MVKEIERYGIPIVHMATIITISDSVGANRIVPTIAIPHPTGDPSVDGNQELTKRTALTERAVNSLASDASENNMF